MKMTRSVGAVAESLPQKMIVPSLIPLPNNNQRKKEGNNFKILSFLIIVRIQRVGFRGLYYKTFYGSNFYCYLIS